MLQKLLELRNDPRFKKFTDVKNISVYVFVLVVLSIAWSSVDVLQRNYHLQKQIDELDGKIAVHELENKTAKLRSEYYNSNTFLELAARRQFGKALPGETVLIVPKEISDKYVAQLPKDPEPVSGAEAGNRGIKATTKYRRLDEVFLPSKKLGSG